MNNVQIKLEDIKMKFKEMSLDRSQRIISIFVDDKQVFEGHTSEVKHKFTREEWNKILEFEVTSTNWYFEIFVIRLKTNTNLKIENKEDIKMTDKQIGQLNELKAKFRKNRDYLLYERTNINPDTDREKFEQFVATKETKSLYKFIELTEEFIKIMEEQ